MTSTTVVTLEGEPPLRVGCLARVARYPFLPGMAATFADYLGMALLTPALPYFLSDVVGLDARGVATWTGAITTAQYAGGAMGNMIVGTMGDKLGSRATLGVTLAGDVLFFTLTAVNRHRGALLAVRFLAGLSSPLVAALHHILKQARDKMHVLEGVNAYSLSVNAGYALGGIIVGLGYDAAGWVGLNLLSAAVAGVAMIAVLALVPPDTPTSANGDGEKAARSEGDAEFGTRTGTSAGTSAGTNAGSAGTTAYSVYRTGAMLSHMYTAFNSGYQFMGFLVLFTLMAKQILGWSPVAIGWSFLAIPIANTITMYYLIPPWVRVMGVHAGVTCSSVGTMFTLALFALPPVHETPAGIMCVTFLLIICVVTVQVPNQMRIKMIADRYAPEQMGRITGASRVCFAVGQTISPVTCAVLYTVHPSLAIASMFVAVAGVPVVFAATGQTFFRDPSPAAEEAESNPVAGSNPDVVDEGEPTGPDPGPVEARA